MDSFFLCVKLELEINENNIIIHFKGTLHTPRRMARDQDQDVKIYTTYAGMEPKGRDMVEDLDLRGWLDVTEDISLRPGNLRKRLERILRGLLG